MYIGIREFEEKVFNISTSSGSGTAFTIRIGEKEYLITAKHVVEDLGSKGVIKLNKINSNVEKEVEIFYPQKPNVDIAVLKYEGILVENPMDLSYDLDNLTITQDAYFLGYPYSKYSCTDSDINNNVYRMPLIKKGIISGVHATRDNVLIFIDAHNNQGFSGGPVVIFDIYNKKPKVCGVVHGYVPYEGEIYQAGTMNSLAGIVYRENTGIMLAYGINHVIEIIKDCGL